MSAVIKPEVDLNLRERQDVLARLRESSQQLVQSVGRVPEELGSARPSTDGWTVLEVVEHLARAEAGMLELIGRRRPTDAQPDRAKDAFIVRMMANRDDKRTAPERSRPMGQYATLLEAAAAFQAARERTIAFATENTENLRQFTVKHPFGIFDAHQVLLIMACHADRHRQQIEDIHSRAAQR